MARVTLLTLIEHGIPYRWAADRSGVPLSIPAYRLRLQLVAVPPDADPDEPPPRTSDARRRIDAVVDTGAPLTTFGHERWSPFATDIRWLDQPSTATGQPRRLTLLGGRWTYRLAQVRLGATDDQNRWLPAVWTPTLCLDANPATDNLALLGLRTPLLDRRRLRHSGNTPDDLPIWWLEDDTA